MYHVSQDHTIFFFCKASPFWLNSNDNRIQDNLVFRTRVTCFSSRLPPLPTSPCNGQPGEMSIHDLAFFN